MNVTLDEIRSLSERLAGLPDDRPAWLRAMPYAMETPSHYYRLLFEFVRQWKPNLVVEIGIDKAGSTMSLAAANPESKVISIDIDEGSCLNARRIAAEHGLSNLTVVHSDSIQALEALRSGPRLLRIDMLFLDGAHDFVHVYNEYQQFRKHMTHDGIIFFDDIHEGKEMEASWDLVLDPKVELPKAHATGFGVCKVNQFQNCPTLAEVLPHVRGRFS